MEAAIISALVAGIVSLVGLLVIHELSGCICESRMTISIFESSGRTEAGCLDATRAVQQSVAADGRLRWPQLNAKPLEHQND